MKLRLRSTVGELYWKKAHDYLDHFLRQKKEAHLKDMNDRAAQGLPPTSSTTSTHRSTGIPPPTVRIPQHPQQQQSQSESGGTSSANSGLSGVEEESLTLDGFSTSATSSKHHKKSSKDKKKDKKSLKRKERKRLKKEEKRRRRERNEKKCIAAEKDGGSKKRKKEYNGEDNDDDDENCFWERDALGNIKKEAVALNCNYADLFDDECSESDEECVFAIDSDEEDSSSIEDVTELVMVKRSMEAKKKLDNAEEICDSDEDAKSPADDHQKKAKKRKSALSASSSKPAKRRKRSVPTESTIEVVIDEKDIPNCPGVKVIQDDDDNNDREVEDGGTEHKIKQKIIKLLNTHFHGASNESEAQNAMTLARRLMERHNLDQALLMQERGDGSLNDFSMSGADGNEEDLYQGGIVTTNIRNRKTQKPLSTISRWQKNLVCTISLIFNVKNYTTFARSTQQEVGESSVAFYGLRTYVQLAAYAFKIASERCSLMTAMYDPPKRKLPTKGQIVETKKARLSYALGLVKGLDQDAKEGLKREKERRNEKLRKAQSAAKKGEAYHDDSDGDIDGNKNEDGVVADNENGNFKIDHEEKGVENIVDQLQRENTALLALIDHHKKIAADVLKTAKIKLRSARRQKSIPLDHNAYNRGVIDSKEIDLNQQAIK
jgi:hypothetical protein